ncbi:MAG: putative signal transducing protein [Gemmatimonadota bacterium]
MCGRTVCASCRRGDRHVALCEEHAGIRVFEGWAEIGRTTDEVEAELRAGTLRAADLDVQVFSQKDHANVVGLGGLAVVRVLVPPSQYESALAALRDADEVGRADIA